MVGWAHGTAGTAYWLRIAALSSVLPHAPSTQVLPACTALLPAVLQGEQEEYAEEGISWSFIDYVDNQGCLDL